jgi:type I restriction enzyme S subunit
MEPTYLRITDIDDDGRFISESKASVDAEIGEDNYLSDGDLVLARTGASVGKSYRYRECDGRLVFAGFLIRVRPDPKKLIPTLLASYLSTRQYWDWVRMTSARSGQPGINGSEYSALPIPLPISESNEYGLTEQQKIADCLTSLDELIAAQRRKVDALKAHKNGLTQQLFPREGENIPRLRFPEFRRRAKWAPKSIGAMLGERARPIEMDDETKYSLVTVKRRYGGVVRRECLNGRAIKVKSQFLVKAKDFLISKRQIVHDACGLVPPALDGSIVSNEYAVLGPKDGCDIEFFNYFSQQPTVSASFLQSSVGIVIEKMLFKLNTWLKLEFLFPSVDEQRRIAACLSALDAQIAAEADKLAALKKHKTGLMQQLFPSPEEGD